MVGVANCNHFGTDEKLCDHIRRLPLYRVMMIWLWIAKFWDNCSNANTPFAVDGPCEPRVEVIPPKIILPKKPTQGVTFVCLTSHNSKSKGPHLIGWIPWARSWSEPSRNKILPSKATRWSNFYFPAPAQFSKHIPPFDWVDPVGPGLEWAFQK